MRVSAQLTRSQQHIQGLLRDLTVISQNQAVFIDFTLHIHRNALLYAYLYLLLINVICKIHKKFLNAKANFMIVNEALTYRCSL